jgi:hypothetical protein
VNARKPRPTNETSQLLPKKVREGLQAVVVDTNAYGAVGPDIIRLGALATDLNAIGVYTWIPEPVAWEWAEHLAKEWTAARNGIKTPADHLWRAGLPLLRLEPHYDDRAAFIAAFLDRLDRIPHVEVVRLTGESAVEGLKDQILQRPPAKTKSNPAVKTGGSDSAWLRDVIAKANGAAGELLFLSEDKDIKAAYQEWEYPLPLLSSERDIRACLFEDVPASIQDIWLVVQYLVGRMPLDLRDPATATDADAPLIGNTPGLVEILDPDPVDYHVVTAANLTQLTALAGLGPVTHKQPEPDHDGKVSSDGPATRRTLMATAFFLAEAEATWIYRDVDSEEVTTHTMSRTGLLVRTRLAFEVHDQTITSARSDSDAVVFTSSCFHENADALEELGDALTAVPELELPEDWGLWKDDTEQQIRIAGKDKVIDLFWSYGDWGNLSLILGDEEVSVHCEYDDDAWVGGSDGIHVNPPYYIVTEGTPFATADAIWAIPAWIIARLVQPDSQDEADA